MKKKIFLTGATGYIGGSVLHRLYSTYPEWAYTVLVRSPEKGKPVKDAFPNVTLAFGDLDSAKVIEDESAAADIVIHTADSSDHEGSAKAIAAGLVRGHSKEKPGYWLHTGGTGILTFADSDAGRLGYASDKVYDDLDGVDELTHLPDHAFHRNIDKLVLRTGALYPDSVRTAIICPSTVYGTGFGPVITRSSQVYDLVKATIQRGKAPIVGPGKAIWNNVHIDDLADMYLLYCDAAAARYDTPQLWGQRGYCLAENGQHVWSEVSGWIAQAAKERGLIPSADVENISDEETKAFGHYSALSWGLNSRCSARRARMYLGWMPHAPSLQKEIPGIVALEQKLLGL
ncbi:hypothetical protein BJ742DRAFT_703983 [Cladochytrium replicatum]|nr:hypothetical protein BJ742DRAFT_703983 [Cladochytrium replicatum]